jgi:hypothetical protein
LKIKNILISVLAVLAVLSWSGILYCAEAKKDVTKKESAKKEVEKEMTREEMLAEIKDKIAYDEDVIPMIQGLKTVKGEKGAVSYTLNGKKLEDLSKADLSGLLNQLNQIVVNLQTERIQRQLEVARQTQGVQRPPSAPQVPRSVQTPKAPPSQPQVPRAVSAHPTPPKR